MKPLLLVALLLIIGGLASLAYQGFSYTTQQKAVDIGPLQVNTKHIHTIPLPPLVGIVSIVAGVGLLVFSSKKV